MTNESGQMDRMYNRTKGCWTADKNAEMKDEPETEGPGGQQDCLRLKRSSLLCECILGVVLG